MTAQRHVKIAGIGSYAPERVLTNQDLEAMVDTSDAWIKKRTGILERRIRAEGQATSDMAYRAAKDALTRAELDPKDLQCIIVGTVTPDLQFPSVGCLLQDRLGCPYIAAFDVSAACTGFLYAVSLGTQLIKGGSFENVLALGCETLSSITDYEDRGTCVLFGDGGGGVVLRATEDEEDGRIFGWDIRADGSGAKLMNVPAGGSLRPATVETVEARQHFMTMAGREIFRFAVEKFIEQIGVAMEKGGLKPEDVDMVFPHQVNIRIISAAVKKIGIPMDKVMINIHEYGNTSAASIPLALDQAVREGRFKKGDTGIMVAFGAGLTWGSVAFRY